MNTATHIQNGNYATSVARKYGSKKNEVIDHLVEGRLSVIQIASLVGCCRTYVYHILWKMEGREKPYLK